MSTINYIRLHQLIPVAVKLTISLNINQVNSTTQQFFKNLVTFMNFHEF